MSKTLLLADDSVTIQKVVGITFASEDIELVTVDNGDDALTRAREIRPDLVLADVSMPGLDGYELCHAIKNDGMLSGTPVVLLTGTFEVQDDSRAAQVGADAQIAKPFEAQALVDLVRGLIGSGGARGGAPVQAVTPSAPLVPPQAVAAPAPEPILELPPTAELELALPELGALEDEPASFVAPEPEAAAEDTDFSFSDLEFAKNATAGAAPDATQVLSGVPPLSADPLSADPEPLQEPVATPPQAAIPEMPEVGIDPIEEEPLSIEPLEPEAPQAPTTPVALSPDPLSLPQGTDMTQPRLASSIDPSMLADADAVPEIDMTDPIPAPAAEQDLAFDKTSLMDPVAASEILENADLEPIPEEPIGSDDSGAGWQPAEPPLAPALLEADPAGVDLPVQEDSHPILASAISSETLDAPSAVQPLGEQTTGGSEIFGDPLGTTSQSMGSSVDEQTEPDVEPDLAPARSSRGDSQLDAADAEAMRDSIEKLAWDAFGPMSEQLVREVVKKIEEIAWDVVPQLAEKIVQQEIRRLTRSDPSD